MEPEQYLDMVVTEWLPRRWEDVRYERALTALADEFVKQHRDPWLREVLAAKKSEGTVRGLQKLAEAHSSNLSDQYDEALADADQAGRQLRASGNAPAALRADFELIYALQRLTRVNECLQHEGALESAATRADYRWMEGQALLSSATCRNEKGDSGGAERDAASALAVGQGAHYGTLTLRAAGILVGVQSDAGNTIATWNRGRKALSEYWSRPHPATLGQQIYFHLRASAQSLGLHQTAYLMQQSAVDVLANTGRPQFEAGNRSRLAQMAVEAGLPNEARIEFELAGALFDQLPPTRFIQDYRALAELNRVQAEISQGNKPAALTRLEAILPRLQHVEFASGQIRAEQIYGDLLWKSGRKDDAESAYRRAIQFTEKSLATLDGAAARELLMAEAGGAYRGLIEVLWEKRRPQEALGVWEAYRSAEALKPGLGARIRPLSHETFLTYALTTSGFKAWLFDDHGIEPRVLDANPAILATTAQRFLRRCADPSSDSTALANDARQLYDWLIAPFADRLDSSRVLVIEPDGPIGAVPVQALLDEHSTFVGERFAITIAASVSDYQRRSQIAPPSAAAKALVIVNPALGKDMTRSFPPLPGTAREGQAVAARFARNTRLIGKGATVAAVERHVPSTELLHFAGHGFSNAGNGGLLLAPDEHSSEGAAVLSGVSMGQTPWRRCRLAVLSACSAGTGEDKGPVNPESLVRGLLWAGVARVVASRWNVQDDSGLLMDRFYDELLHGKDTSTALQVAARELRAKPETSHPYYWAGFQDFGTR